MEKNYRSEIHGFRPINKQSKIVASSVSQLIPQHKPSSMARSINRLPTMQFIGRREHNLAGMKKGNLTVIGVFLRQNPLANNGGGGLRWVVQCICGYYEIRTYKAITNPRNINECCHECRNLKYLARNERSVHLKTT